MTAATIKLFLAEGSSTGVRVGEVSNWSGIAVAGPRTNLDGLLARQELAGPGIYFLIGTDPDSESPLVYIGEAETLCDRIRQQTKKESWVQAIAFSSKDENLSKGHIRYLEGRIIELAKSADRAVIQNSQASGAKLPESDTADMEVFLDRVRQLLPVLGTDVLVPKGKSESPKSTVLTCKIKGLEARGERTDTGFVVYKGSQAVMKNRPSATSNILSLRKRLIESKVLAREGDHYVFARDEEFGSPSYAAAAVRGGNSSGPTIWKDDTGKTLKELETGD